MNQERSEPLCGECAMVSWQEIALFRKMPKYTHYIKNHTTCTDCLQSTLNAHTVYKSHYMHTLFTNHTTCTRCLQITLHAHVVCKSHYMHTLFANHIIQYWSRTTITDNMWIIFRESHAASSVKLTTGKNNWTMS